MRKLSDKKNVLYALVSVVFTVITNQIVYQGTKIFNLHYHAWDISMPIDHTFKVVPWTISIYVGSYIIWAVSYFVIAMQDDREQSERFFARFHASSSPPCPVTRAYRFKDALTASRIVGCSGYIDAFQRI